MFRFIAAAVTRHGWAVVLAWLILAGVLYKQAPPWERVSRDDDVRFFPAGYPSVVGQELLERGFPRDAASSQVVLAYERTDGRLTAADFAYVEEVASSLWKHSREVEAAKQPDEPGLGIRKIDTMQTPVVGPRLVSSWQEGKGQAVLSMVSMNGTYLAKSTRLGVDRIEKFLAKAPKPPAGLIWAITGSAVVGHDMNSATT